MRNVVCPKCNGSGIILLKKKFPESKDKEARCNLCFGTGKTSRLKKAKWLVDQQGEKQ